MKKIILAPILLSMLFLNNQFSNAQCHLNDWTALKALYESTNGDNWTDNSGWEIVTLDVPPIDCDLTTLYGVTADRYCILVDGDDIACYNDYIVIVLDLSNNNLIGTIPTEIGNLQFLTDLFLYNNQLTGCYPNEINQLCNQLSSNSNTNSAISEGNSLNTIWADFCSTANGVCSPTTNCRQTDSIALLSIYQSLKPNNGWDFSQSIDNWSGVTLNENGCVDRLDLEEYHLNGVIPSTIGNLSEITYLNLSQNYITGFIPEQIANLTNLEFLHLGSNDIEGAVPTSINHLTNLEILDISGNRINSIPESIDNLYGLTELYLSSNQINTLPATIGNLINLQVLHLTSNNLTEIPSTIGNLTNLVTLYLRYNQLTELPYSFGNLTNLSYAFIDNNQLYSLPASMSNLVSLISLYLNNNQLRNIDFSFSSLVNLQFLYLENNSLEKLPNSISNLTQVTILSANNNQITGKLPSWLAQVGLSNLYIQDNQFSGCYEDNLQELCNQLWAPLNTNEYISNGNNFDASWEDFCQTNLGACLQSPSAVSTNYSGDRNPTVINENDEYVLKNNDVQVFNFSTCSLTDIENCDPITGFGDWAANEVLWAIEKGVQYFTDNFGMSLSRVNCLVNSNYNSKPNSSFYNIDTKALIFGMGDGIERNTMTAPDIVGHELMHFVIANLNDDFCIYGECGALNESFADIFGEVLEYISRGSNDWVFGSEVLVANNSGIRSLSNPNDVTMQNVLPDTYLGNFWVNQNESALAGIHTNNGVQNYWFYLLANGGTGTNNHGLNYNVQGIGIEKAAEITFTNLFNNLTPAATYMDAMYGSINVAKELHGENSNEVQQTIAAWEAVGLTPIQYNPISWRVINYEEGTPIGRELPIQFDLEIDSLGQDINADDLIFSLHLPKNYNLEIVSIYAPLTISEVDTMTINNKLVVQINRQSGGAQKTRSVVQRIKSGEPIVKVGGCLEMPDVSSDCLDIPAIDISGGTAVSNDNDVTFQSSTLLFGSECDEGDTLKRSNKDLNDDILNIVLQLNHQTCLNLGALRIEILDNLEDSTMPYQYYLFNQNGEEINNELQSFNPKYQFYNLEEGIYKLRVEDITNRYFIKNFEVKFIAGMNGSTCCPEKLIIPPGEHTGYFDAINRISIKSGTRINVGKIETCEN